MKGEFERFLGLVETGRSRAQLGFRPPATAAEIAGWRQRCAVTTTSGTSGLEQGVIRAGAVEGFEQEFDLLNAKGKRAKLANVLAELEAE